MQRRSMLYEKVVNIEANYTAALHWIAIDTEPCVFGMNRKWLQEWIQKCWQPYKTTFASTGRLVTYTKKVQWDTVISHCRPIDVITFMWQTKHLGKKNCISVWCFSVSVREITKETHTQKQTDIQEYTHTYSEDKVQRWISVLNVWLWSALFDVHSWRNEFHLIFPLWPASCFDIKLNSVFLNMRLKGCESILKSKSEKKTFKVNAFKSTLYYFILFNTQHVLIL